MINKKCQIKSIRIMLTNNTTYHYIYLYNIIFYLQNNMQKNRKNISKQQMKTTKMNHEKKNNNIKRLSQNLFSKLQNLQSNSITTSDLLQKISNQYLNDISPVSTLLDRANQATKNGAHLINSTKKLSRNKDNNTFLTGTGIYEFSQSIKSLESTQTSEIISQKDLLKQLMTDDKFDDLQQLRKMLKETGQNIEDCKKKAYKTQKTLVSYVNTLNLEKGTQRKINSMNKIINKLRL